MAKSDSDFFGDEKPFVAGFLRGYRAWMPGAGSMRLRSVAMMNYWWNTGVNTAGCRYRNAGCDCLGCRIQHHVAPVKDCSCGFYAMHSPAAYAEIADAYVGSCFVSYNRLIFGCIKATGNVVVGTKGFRAQHAEVEAICGTHPDGEKIAELYGIPWLSGDLEKLAKEFPVTLLENVQYMGREDIDKDLIAYFAQAIGPSRKRWQSVSEPTPEPTPRVSDNPSRWLKKWFWRSR